MPEGASTRKYEQAFVVKLGERGSVDTVLALLNGCYDASSLSASSSHLASTSDAGGKAGVHSSPPKARKAPLDTGPSRKPPLESRQSLRVQRLAAGIAEESEQFPDALVLRVAASSTRRDVWHRLHL